MRTLIIPYLALGLILSHALNIEYNCEGQDVFPIYYGSPFIFQQTSLASSMEHFYSVTSLVLNILVWSAFLFFVDKMISKIKTTKSIKLGYKVVVGIMLFFSTFNILMDSLLIGHGFNKYSNNWYWDIDKEAKEYGMHCEGSLQLF
ncbi:hypothetical protein [Flammeovirga aprica]|uniref:Uncharacterized protein n=1 Tax=Flammeovirga aprica JL-4 TaxID=694437 RepID=A0A7X9RZB6_9BACT|nr:hypothetical protein [Flammeovirga aprica]NME71392.1 hypothetical protein [Flammeovirga aprica JL-4]